MTYGNHWANLVGGGSWSEHTTYSRGQSDSKVSQAGRVRAIGWTGDDTTGTAGHVYAIVKDKLLDHFVRV